MRCLLLAVICTIIGRSLSQVIYYPTDKFYISHTNPKAHDGEYCGSEVTPCSNLQAAVKNDTFYLSRHRGYTKLTFYIEPGRQQAELMKVVIDTHIPYYDLTGLDIDIRSSVEGEIATLPCLMLRVGPYVRRLRFIDIEFGFDSLCGEEQLTRFKEEDDPIRRPLLVSHAAETELSGVLLNKYTLDTFRLYGGLMLDLRSYVVSARMRIRDVHIENVMMTRPVIEETQALFPEYETYQVSLSVDVKNSAFTSVPFWTRLPSPQIDANSSFRLENSTFRNVVFAMPGGMREHVDQSSLGLLLQGGGQVTVRNVTASNMTAEREATGGLVKVYEAGDMLIRDIDCLECRVAVREFGGAVSVTGAAGTRSLSIQKVRCSGHSIGGCVAVFDVHIQGVVSIHSVHAFGSYERQPLLHLVNTTSLSVLGATCTGNCDSTPVDPVVRIRTQQEADLQLHHFAFVTSGPAFHVATRGAIDLHNVSAESVTPETPMTTLHGIVDVQRVGHSDKPVRVNKVSIHNPSVHYTELTRAALTINAGDAKDVQVLDVSVLNARSVVYPYRVLSLASQSSDARVRVSRVTGTSALGYMHGILLDVASANFDLSDVSLRFEHCESSCKFGFRMPWIDVPNASPATSRVSNVHTQICHEYPSSNTPSVQQAVQEEECDMEMVYKQRNAASPLSFSLGWQLSSLVGFYGFVFMFTN
ncbi:MAG: hypothetical protein MHM6MM_003479 [Cercozoa sp. M6MM]